MASFFTFPEAGFGGYVTLQGALRGTGRFPLLLARMEERMIRDALGARSWYIECDPRQEALFARHGFRTIDCVYRQPPLPDGVSEALEGSPALRLMYKDFGRNFEAPKLAATAFLSAIGRIFTGVYRLESVEQSPFYRHLRGQAARWPGDTVRFR
jgi:hypothetical protein